MLRRSLCRRCDAHDLVELAGAVLIALALRAHCSPSLSVHNGFNGSSVVSCADAAGIPATANVQNRTRNTATRRANPILIRMNPHRPERRWPPCPGCPNRCLAATAAPVRDVIGDSGARAGWV
nr:hypothetical protein [Kibdelosporangium sp. MJ126-NF4]CTQ98016.1 hypothetical protein [Kibdelosporangium sp. MJ126-NF4]